MESYLRRKRGGSPYITTKLRRSALPKLRQLKAAIISERNENVPDMDVLEEAIDTTLRDWENKRIAAKRHHPLESAGFIKGKHQVSDNDLEKFLISRERLD